MDNERIENRAIFGLKYPRDRLDVQCICRKTIYRFGGDGNEFAGREELPCFIYIFTDLSHAVAKVNVIAGIVACLFWRCRDLQEAFEVAGLLFRV